MHLQITRSSGGDLYTVSVGYGAGTRPGVNRSQLRDWLRELGAADAAIESVLAIAPRESVALEVLDSWRDRDAAS